MGNRSKNKIQMTENTGKKKQKLGYGRWLFRKEGTAAEPWPTAEDLWNNPKVQKAIQNHRELIKQKRNGS